MVEEEFNLLQFWEVNIKEMPISDPRHKKRIRGGLGNYISLRQ